MSISEKELYTAVLKAVRKLREIVPKRNFTQAIEVQISLRDIDLRKPENRFRLRVRLPHPIAEKDKIVVFADDPHVPPLKPLQENGEVIVVDKAKLEELRSNIRQFKKLARRNRIFISSATLMGTIGKYFGKILSPRNKMPIPAGITDNILTYVEDAKKTILVRLHKSPTVHAKVGNINMSDEELAENITSFIMTIKDKLPKGWRNIRSIHIKATMGSPVKVELFEKKKAA